MIPLIIMAVIIGLSVLLGLIFRVSAVFLFVSVTAGELLVRVVGDDAGLALGAFVKNQNTTIIAQLVLLVLPLVFTILLLKKSLAKSKVLLHIVPFVAVGALLFLFIVPIFPSSLQAQILGDPITNSVVKSQDLIIGASSLLILVTMWTTYRHHEKHHGKRHK